MALLTRQRLCPGGWQFSQKNNDGVPVRNRWAHSMSSFGEFVREVQSFRQANGYTNIQGTADEIDAYQCERLGNNAQWCAQKKTETPMQFFRAPVASVKAAVERAAAGFTRLNEGRKILQEWLGEGGVPVSQVEAQRRADICASCPANLPGLAVVDSVAGIIKSHVSAKTEAKLAVTGEETLHTCKVCACHLPLKIWVPLNFLHVDLSLATNLQDANPNCWQIPSGVPFSEHITKELTPA